MLGDPNYYGRFGFRAQTALTLPGVPQDYFRAIAFRARCRVRKSPSTTRLTPKPNPVAGAVAPVFSPVRYNARRSSLPLPPGNKVLRQVLKLRFAQCKRVLAARVSLRYPAQALHMADVEKMQAVRAAGLLRQRFGQRRLSGVFIGKSSATDQPPRSS